MNRKHISLLSFILVTWIVGYGNAAVALSVVNGMAGNVLLEQKGKQLVIFVFVMAVVILVLLTLLITLVIRRRQEQGTATRANNDTYTMLRTLVNAQDDLVYLKDDKLRYVFMNRAFEHFCGKKTEQVFGLDDYALTEYKFADLCRKTDLDVVEKGTIIRNEVEWNGKILATTKFPVQMTDGQNGVGAYIRDVTQQRLDEKKSVKAIRRHIILDDVLSRSFPSVREQLDHVLRVALELAESQHGFVFLCDEGFRTLTLSAWTEGALGACGLDANATYQIEGTGSWSEMVRQKKPIILNDLQGVHPLSNAEEKLALKRLVMIPVIMDERVVAAVNMVNKQEKYDEIDVEELSVFLHSAWNALKRHEIQEKLAYEHSRYLQTLVSIGDGVLVVSREGRVEMLNAVAQKLTGWAEREAIGRHYSEVFVIRNECAEESIVDPVVMAMGTGTTQDQKGQAVLISQNGESYNLENNASPIRNGAGETVGVVLVFRDVTQKKKELEQIEYLSYHDPLTGLYNRRYFVAELRRLDTLRNLPLTIVMGDLNGLKLTNDVFGHAFGDQLLERLGNVMRRCCRADDIIARWGGDEFVLLLPKTGPGDAQKMIEQIKNEFSKVRVKSIKGSISMGIACKEKPETDVSLVLSNAEEDMYHVKTVERDEVRKSTVDELIATLHENSAREREHSEATSAISEAIGRAMDLPEEDIRKLRDAGYFHDIGKIVLDSRLINISHHLTNYEWSEIKRHPIVGYRILTAFDETLNLAEPILAHQERWDGSGYPRGLKGSEIPLLARIIAVAESYDRMTHDSANTLAMNNVEAILTMRQNAGSQFDPEIVRIFTEILERSNEEDACYEQSAHVKGAVDQAHRGISTEQ